MAEMKDTGEARGGGEGRARTTWEIILQRRGRSPPEQ